MKHLIIAVAFVFFTISGIGKTQINNRLLGLQLGLTTMQQAKRILKGRNLSFLPSRNYPSSILISNRDIIFGDYTWNDCQIAFSKGRFMELYLKKNYKDKDLAYIDYSTVHNVLLYKYSDCSVLEDSSDEYSNELRIRDKNTLITLRCTKIDGIEISVTLNYEDIALAIRDKNHGYDEF